MAQNDLVGNMATEDLISFLEQQDIGHDLNIEEFQKAQAMISSVFI
jgi:hypothetical protein